MVSFLRSELVQLTAYTPHPGGGTEGASASLPAQIDHLDTNESPLDLPSELKAELARLYQETLATNRYPDGDHGALKAAISTYVEESATLPPSSLTPEHISAGNGSDELIRSLLIATCLGGHGSILVAEPTFSMYAILAKTLGIPVISVPRQPDTFAVDLPLAQQALAQVAHPPIRVVFMVHPNSPTANALTSAELDWLLSLPQDILVVVDEAYFEFSQHTTVATVLTRPNWVVLRTFSKAFRLASHRVGYAVAQPGLIAALEKVRLPYNLPGFSQAAALLALEHRHRLLQAIPLILAERERLLTSLQDEAALRVWPSAANFLYVRPLGRFRAAQDSDSLSYLFQALKQRGTLVRQTGGGLRITVGLPEENTRTLAHLQHICQPAAVGLPSS